MALVSLDSPQCLSLSAFARRPKPFAEPFYLVLIEDIDSLIEIVNPRS